MTTYDNTDHADPRVQAALDRLDDLGPLADRADLIEVYKQLPRQHQMRRVLAGFLDGSRRQWARGSWDDSTYREGWHAGHALRYRPFSSMM
jgi:hypothetical protein